MAWATFLIAVLFAWADAASGQNFVPVAILPGTVIPVNSTVDSQGNNYTAGISGPSNLPVVLKTTPAGVTTVIATAQYTQLPTGPLFTYAISGIVVDAFDNVYAAESPTEAGGTSGPELILKVSPAGVVTTTSVTAGPLVFGKRPNSCSLTVDSQGNIYTVGVDGSIYEITPGGIQSTVLADSIWFYDNIGDFPNYPQGLSVDGQGDLFTNVTHLNTDPGYSGPGGICDCDASGSRRFRAPSLGARGGAGRHGHSGQSHYRQCRQRL